MTHRAIRVALGVLGVVCSLTTGTWAADPPVAQEYGTIKGRLVWGGSEAPAQGLLVKKGDASKKDPKVCAVGDLVDRSLVVDPETKGVAYAFAYLPKPTGKNEAAVKALVAATPEAVLDQKNCEFLPYAMAVHQDQKVVFKSSDPVLHNVRYTGFSNPSQNLALPPNGSYKATLKAERRQMELACDVHPWMKGWLMIFDHPFFAVTDAEGNFEIQGVPPGEQFLIVWQERIGYVTEGKAKGISVMVKAGEVTTLPDVVLDPSKLKDAKSTSR